MPWRCGDIATENFFNGIYTAALQFISWPPHSPGLWFMTSFNSLTVASFWGRVFDLPISYVSHHGVLNVFDFWLALRFPVQEDSFSVAAVQLINKCDFCLELKKREWCRKCTYNSGIDFLWNPKWMNVRQRSLWDSRHPIFGPITHNGRLNNRIIK